MSSDESVRELPSVELVERTKNGESNAREELFERYGARVLQIVRMRLGAKLRERVDSMDITQEVLAEAVGRLDKFEMRDESSLLRWMARLTENRLRNEAKYQRAAKRNAGMEVGLDAPRPNSLPKFDAASNLPTPSVELNRNEQVQNVRESISELTQRYRDIILLRDYTGSS